MYFQEFKRMEQKKRKKTVVFQVFQEIYEQSRYEIDACRIESS